MADRLDRFIEAFSKILDLGAHPYTRIERQRINLAIFEAKAALAEEDLGEQLIEGGKQALEYALNVKYENNKFSDQPAEEKPHPNAVWDDKSGFWHAWIDGALQFYFYGHWRVDGSPPQKELIARAKAAAGVGDE